MNVWIDIAHIPQFNFYRKFIHYLSEAGHRVYVTVLDRGRLANIVKFEISDVRNVSVDVIGKHRLSKVSAILDANVVRLVKLLSWTRGKNINVAFSNHHQTSIIAKILGIPGYAFGDDPQSKIYPAFVKFATQSHMLIYEDANNVTLEKDKVMPVLKEWAYLSPKEFQPNISALSKYGVEPKKYLFLREVTVGTTNYVGQAAGAILNVKELIDGASYIDSDGSTNKMKVLFSLEKKNTRDDYPKDWILLQEPVDDIHSLIYYSAGLVSSGDSMAREAALLGVPSYYLGIRYSMPANAVASKVANLHNQKTMPFEQWIKTLNENADVAEKYQNELRKEINNKFIDINDYMIGLVNEVANKKDK